LLAMTVATMAMEVIPLDMAPDSFDDQYQGCGPAMKAELWALNRSEFQKNLLFAKIWSEAVKEWQTLGSPVSPLSSSGQAIAIMAYTVDGLYKQFNHDVRVFGRSPQEYWDHFHFKTLHFLLTDALATLRDAQGQQCHCVFRGVDNYKFEANVVDIFRFRQFVWSWFCENIEYSWTTVFKVRTCHGADIKKFTRFADWKEVLIPPFEKFNMTKVMEKGTSVEIHLNSIGTYSKYNCE
ncbi:NARE ribosyltransferase, partial [Cercotrichas coryphoeus]|nr:NARE ribosyltransferase [Cercotrichas coryphoeus]